MTEWAKEGYDAAWAGLQASDNPYKYEHLNSDKIWSLSYHGNHSLAYVAGQWQYGFVQYKLEQIEEGKE